MVSKLPRNYTCEDVESLSTGDVDTTLQCGIDHLKSGNLNDDDSETVDENSDDGNENNGVVMLEEEYIVDPTLGKLRN